MLHPLDSLLGGAMQAGIVHTDLGRPECRPPATLAAAAFEAHRPALLRFAMAQLRNRACAEDVVQETLLAALRASERFSGKSSPRTWLIGILKHKIVDHRRVTSREQALDEERETESLEHGESGESAFAGATLAAGAWANPEHALARKKFLESLEIAMAALPRTAARAFVLREVMGLDSAEISRELAISARHCAVMLHRARTALRVKLAGNWFDQRPA